MWFHDIPPGAERLHSNFVEYPGPCQACIRQSDTGTHRWTQAKDTPWVIVLEKKAALVWSLKMKRRELGRPGRECGLLLGPFRRVRRCR